MTNGGVEPGTGEPLGDAGAAARAPAPAPAPARRVRRWRRSAVPMTRLVVVLALIVSVFVVATTVAVVIGPPSEGELLKQAKMTGKHELLVGVKDDQPGVGLRDKVTGVYSGFDVDIAYMIASDLGFRRSEVRFLSIESEDRERMRARDPQSGKPVTVDMVIASFSITQKRIDEGVNFSVPYLVTEQSVVTRKGHRKVEALSDLAEERVCTIGTSTSADAVKKEGIANVTLQKQISTCMDGLVKRHPSYDAVTTDAAILAGFVQSDDPRYKGRLEHHDIGLEARERWGVSVPDEALRTLVNLYLYRSWHDADDRRWEDAYDRNLRPEQVDSPEQDVADDHQPEFGRPAVREWPWQH